PEPFGGGGGHVVRLTEEAPGEKDVEQAETRGEESRRLPAERIGEGAEHRPYGDAEIGRRRDPAEAACPLLGATRVRHVRLDDAYRAATRALHEAGQQEEPD